MKNVITADAIPASSIILNGFNKSDYADCYQINIPSNDSVDILTTKIFNSPGWADYLMEIRNKIVSVFGLKTGSPNYANQKTYYPVGSRAGFFTVVDRNENEIVMAENDKHLNFRVSTFTERNGDYLSVFVTTIVKFNNLFGRLYFFIVKPFHRIIVKSTMKKVQAAYR